MHRRTTCRRPGFTLVELMAVTIIIGIMALIVAAPVTRAREAAMVGATRAELRYAMEAIEMHWALEHALPRMVEDLMRAGFEPSLDIAYCRFERLTADGRPSHVELEAQHFASRTRVSARYPGFTGFHEREAKGLCFDLVPDELPGSDGDSGAGSGDGSDGDRPGRRTRRGWDR